MGPTTHIPYEPATDPDTAVAEGEPDRMDEGLHYGRAWHRYAYCYRHARPLRVLNAGCGTARSSVWAARMNPGASVLGVAVSPESIRFARERVEFAGLSADVSVEFRVHDLADPLPDGWGRFDFIFCRGVLARAADPPRMLANLVQALDPSGLLLVPLPSQGGAGRQVARALRQAVEAVVGPAAGLVESTEVALELFHSLRPDHPIHAHVARTQHADPAHVLAGYLAERNDWTLTAAVGMLSRAGLRFLYLATPWRWRPDRVFTPALSGPLRDRLERLAPNHLSHMIDALDPAMLDDEYHLYSCLSSFEPSVPSWPSARLDDPRTFDCLVPELTGLVQAASWRPSAQGRVTYTTLSGTLGELDRMSNLFVRAVDGITPCGEIERALAPQTRGGDAFMTRQERWIDLADGGIILLRPPESR
jgi:SAM-dependent methyltransferase